MSNGVTIYDQFKGDDDFAEMTAQDRIISRFTLMQSGSKPVKAEVARAGSWINSSTQETVATKDQTFKCIPLIYWKKWVEWNPQKGVPKDKMIIKQTSNPEDPLAIEANSFPRRTVLVMGKQKAAITEYYVYLCIAPSIFGGVQDMFTLELCRSAHKVGKAWLNRQQQFKTKLPDGRIVAAPMGTVEWEIGAQVEHNAESDSDYYVPKVLVGTLVSPDTLGQILQLKEKVKAEKDKLSRRDVATEDGEDIKTVDASVETEL